MKFDYLINKIKSSPFREEPFKHIYIEDFFTQEDFRSITNDSEIKIKECPNDEELFSELFKQNYKDPNVKNLESTVAQGLSSFVENGGGLLICDGNQIDPTWYKENWGLKVSEYLQLRQSLAGLVLLMDIRHPLQKFDLQILTWAIHAGVPVHALLTKSDKVSKGKANNMLLNVDREFKHLDPTEELLTFQIFSSPKKVGVIDLKETLDHWFTSNFSLPTQNL